MPLTFGGDRTLSQGTCQSPTPLTRQRLSSPSEFQPGSSTSKRLSLVLGLNLTLLTSLLVVGLSSHSLSVFAEGVDYLADAAGIALSLIAIRIAKRRPASRLPKIAALSNVAWLLALNLIVIVTSCVRLIEGSHPVDGVQVLVISVIAAAVMGFGAVVLADSNDDDDAGTHLNRKVILLDTAADAATALTVALTGGIIATANGLYWLDPLAAILISLTVGYRAIRLLQKTLPL